jgi:hypothetical protein
MSFILSHGGESGGCPNNWSMLNLSSSMAVSTSVQKEQYSSTLSTRTGPCRPPQKDFSMTVLNDNLFFLIVLVGGFEVSGIFSQ